MAPIEDLSVDQPQRARRLLQQAAKNPTSYPDTLQAILTDIIKPLFISSSPFSSKTNDKITDTGRKRLIPLPTIPGSFNDSYDVLTNDPATVIKCQPWKNGWTVPLIQDLLTTQYYNVPTTSTLEDPANIVVPKVDSALSSNARKKAIESHFHLFIPPILQMIDDTDLSYRSQGCDCLTALCHLLSSVDSDIMNRSGLGEVFITTLQGNLSWLPPLTEEKEAIELLRSLYPAYFATVKVGFTISTAQSKRSMTDIKPLSTRLLNTRTQLQSTQLTYLLRHGILHGLSHLSSTGLTNPTNTISPLITAFLLSQLSPLIEILGFTATRRHTQYLFPLLRSIISDPFVLTTTSLPKTEEEESSVRNSGGISMLTAALQASQTLIAVLTSSPRAGGKTRNADLQHWSAECLRGLVACYLNIQDELESSTSRQTESNTQFEITTSQLRTLVKLLVRNATVDAHEIGATDINRDREDGRQSWEKAIAALIAVDGRVGGLFDGCFDDDDDDHDDKNDVEYHDHHAFEIQREHEGKTANDTPTPTTTTTTLGVAPAQLPVLQRDSRGPTVTNMPIKTKARIQVLD